eukprot:6893670-Lingulodinium_polyedra.AAC.1
MRQSKQKAKVLPRGVTKADNTPAYLLRAALARITGQDLSIFTNLDPQDVKEYFILGVVGSPDFKYPLKKCDVEYWIQWCVTQHVNRGQPLTKAYPALECDATEIDWDVK